MTENIEPITPTKRFMDKQATRFNDAEVVQHADCILPYGAHDVNEELHSLAGFEEFLRENKADWTEL